MAPFKMIVYDVNKKQNSAKNVIFKCVFLDTELDKNNQGNKIYLFTVKHKHNKMHLTSQQKLLNNNEYLSSCFV